MDRIHDILNSVNETLANAAQKTYKGQKRSELKDSDFLFPETRSFPIVTPQDIPDAISNFGRMKGEMSYDAFLSKLYNMAKRKGPQFVAALPQASKDKLGIKKTKANLVLQPGDKVKNINTSCIHYGSEGVVNNIESLPDNMGDVVVYTTTNEGPSWKVGDKLKKTEVQLVKAEETEEIETPEMEMQEEMQEYKDSYYGMSVGSLKAIASHTMDILNNLENPTVKENLTAAHLQGMIAVAEDHLRSIHDFVMFVDEDDDTEESDSAVMTVEPQKEKKKKRVRIKDLPHYTYYSMDDDQDDMEENNTMSEDKPGLWNNIRKKKERMGKNYRPAKPGQKDRPNPEQWKNLTE